MAAIQIPPHSCRFCACEPMAKGVNPRHVITTRPGLIRQVQQGANLYGRADHGKQDQGFCLGRRGCGRSRFCCSSHSGWHFRQRRNRNRGSGEVRPIRPGQPGADVKKG